MFMSGNIGRKDSNEILIGGLLVVLVTENLHVIVKRYVLIPLIPLAPVVYVPFFFD